MSITDRVTLYPNSHTPNDKVSNHDSINIPRLLKCIEKTQLVYTLCDRNSDPTRSKMLSVVAGSVLSNSWIYILVAFLAFIPIYLYLTRPPDIQLPGPQSYLWPLSIFAHNYAVKKAKGNHLYLHELYKKYGKIFKVVLFGRSPTICIGEPEMAKLIMAKNFDKFPNRGFPFEIPPPFDSELFLSKYSKWKRLRKVASPAFSAVKLKGTLDSVEEAATRLNEKLMKYSQSGKTLSSLCRLITIYIASRIIQEVTTSPNAWTLM